MKAKLFHFLVMGMGILHSLVGALTISTLVQHGFLLNPMANGHKGSKLVGTGGVGNFDYVRESLLRHTGTDM